MAYTAAAEQVLDEPLPVGLGLRVSVPDMNKVSSPPGLLTASLTAQPPKTGPDGLCEFDQLSISQVRVQ
jgi:ubiquitin-conjugating enzyme E2 Q